MIEVALPHGETFHLGHAVFDFNGTLATDGTLPSPIGDRLRRLADRLTLHVITANTTGSAPTVLAGLPVDLALISERPGAAQKAALVDRLGASSVVAIGNGRNDAAMLTAAALGIVVLGPEGAAGEAFRAADVIVPNIESALDCLLETRRLVATLRP